MCAGMDPNPRLVRVGALVLAVTGAGVTVCNGYLAEGHFMDLVTSGLLLAAVEIPERL